MNQINCCEKAKSLRGESCWEYNQGEGWSVFGCCGGGCYVLDGMKFCPFCRNALPVTCAINHVENFYSESALKACDYGCYKPDSIMFKHAIVDGVAGAYVYEAVCPVHGVVSSPLGGVWDRNRPAHPCGAYKQGDDI